MLLLGLDIGTSSVKASVVDAETQQCITSAQFPDVEAPIISLQPGWAEQNPDDWWSYVKNAIKKLNASGKYNSKDIAAIGIAYQMHGLVMIDQNGNCLRNSIIWCDSRAVPFGEKAFEFIGEQKCLSSYLNSPGNFTAAKLAWVKKNEPEIFEQVYKIMLPGDFIAFKLTNSITTSVSSLSEGIFWDFKKNKLAKKVFDHFGFDKKIIPEIKNVFEPHGYLSDAVADELNLDKNIPVTYKAGDQPNNALSLNVMQPGEVAATAGTSGVIYGVADQLVYDKQSRLNSFAHVNHQSGNERIGVLLCINGCGIMNKTVKQFAAQNLSYDQMNEQAATIPVGSDGLSVLPFGNGAERIFNNKLIGAHFQNLDLNKHSAAHLFRATQEGIAFSFRYGFDIMKENGMKPSLIRAGKTNMFLSEVFAKTFVSTTGVPVELYEADGSTGAALGAGIGASFFKETDLHKGQKRSGLIEPEKNDAYEEAYQRWKRYLKNYL
jgi:xylulokinase